MTANMTVCALYMMVSGPDSTRGCIRHLRLSVETVGRTVCQCLRTSGASGLEMGSSWIMGSNRGIKKSRFEYFCNDIVNDKRHTGVSQTYIVEHTAEQIAYNVDVHFEWIVRNITR